MSYNKSMKNTFVQELGTHLFDETIENSYYNDECDVECYTPDYDCAYQYIRSKPEITKEDLSKTFKVESYDDEEYGDDDGKVEYTGVDLLKLAVNGDFDGENNHHSSELENLRMCLDLIKKTKGDKKIWEYKKNATPEKCKGYSAQEYKKNLCDNHRLTELVATRAESVCQRWNPEGVKLAAAVGSLLRGYKGFEGKENCRTLESLGCPTTDITKAAALIKNKSYEKLGDIRMYELQIACSRHLIYGKSGHEDLDKMVDSIKPIKDILQSRSHAIEL